jgi:excisionase family DNA binding protein
MAMVEQPLLTVLQVAQRLNISPLSVRRQIARGTLPAVKLGNAGSAPLRVDPAELERYLERHATGRAA